MRYLRTVCIATSLCLVVLLIRSALTVILQVLAGEATGTAFLEHGLVQLVVIAILLGWLAGTLWYGVRRFILRTRT